jgi:tetratricopeptide (TPR) repeat protein
MTSAKTKELGRLVALWDRGDLDKAMDGLKQIMLDHPDDPSCVALAAHIYEKSGNIPVAYNLFKQARDAEPGEASHWLNFGRCAEDLWREAEAERAYNRAISITNRNSTKVMCLGNLAAMHIDHGRYDKARAYLDKAMRIDPTSRTVVSNVGFCQLAEGNWAEGWKNYHQNIGTDWRKRVQYGDEPEWDGTPGQAVVLYGEQGLGDEICFASMIDDAARSCRKLIVECDHRLERLYKRSFPQATIYGTRHKKHLGWAKDDQSIDASLPIGQAAEFLRQSPSDCPQDPYLIADADRVAMWKALWKSKGKPAIGIAWSGGIPRTGEKFRYAGLDAFAGLLDLDAHFVSLQYKGDETHPKVHEYPYATRTADYDDTAALVASLDLVVSVPTAVVHLAGALGTKVIAMHGPIECWKYSCDIPFHPADHVKWAGDWRKTVDAATERVKECLEFSSDATRDNPWPTTSSPTPSSDTQADPLRLRRSA